MFSWGPTVSETPEQMHEKMEDVPELKNVEMNWAWMYAPFKGSENTKIESTDSKSQEEEDTEWSLNIWFDDVNNALVSDEIDIASISYESKEKEKEDITDWWENSIESDTTSEVDNWDIESQEKLLSIDEKIDAIKWNIYVPTIELLFKNWLITIDEHIVLVNHIYENKSYDNKVDLSKITWLENISIIEEYFNKVDTADKLGKDNKNYENFIKDFPDYKNEWNNNDGLENAIFSIIGRNYIKVEWTNLPADISKEKSLLNAIETSANKIDFYSKNTPKDSQTYKNAIKNIHSGNVEKALEWFDSLYILVFSNEWITWAWMEKWKKALKKSIDSRKSKIQEKIELIEQQIQSWKLSDIEKNENIEELNNLKEEGKEIEKWDIFISWKQDIQNESNIWESNENV